MARLATEGVDRSSPRALYPTLKRCTFSGNAVPTTAAQFAQKIASNIQSISNCSFIQNQVAGDDQSEYSYGGAVAIQHPAHDSTREIVYAVFDGNQCKNEHCEGGALYLYLEAGNGLSISHSMFRSNFAVSWGGALALGASQKLSISESEFIKNMAGNGGALYTYDDSVTERIYGCHFKENVAQRAGYVAYAGAVYNSGTIKAMDTCN